MQARVEELPENKVRVTVDVSQHDMKHAVEHAASDLSANVKVPGFRKGKVPIQVLISRVGKERLYSEAIESHIEGWYRNALAGMRIRPVTRPEYQYDLPENSDGDFSFTATVDVQPKVDVVDWTMLQVPAAPVEVPPELLDEQLEALRFAVAELVPVDGRAAQQYDTAVVDLVGAGETQRDYVIELGMGQVVEELDSALVGMTPGETKAVGYELEGREPGHVEVTLKELKEKVLPPLDDDLARAASEFETLAELRADIEGRLREQIEAEVEAAFRAAAADALVEASKIQPSAALVQARTAELLTGLVRSLESRGVSPETYLAAINQTPQDLEGRLRAQATRSVARELALEAVADKVDLQVTDEELREFIRASAEAEGEADPDAVVDQIFAAGRHELLREDLRLRRALDLVAEQAERIPLELARAREQLWTPEKGAAAPETKLWTPGSKET